MGSLFASLSNYEVVLHHSLPITICLCNKTFRSFSHRVSCFRLQKSSPHSDWYSRIWSLQHHEHNGFLGIASSGQRSQLTHHSQSLPSGPLPLLASVLHAKVSRSEHPVCVGYTRMVFFLFCVSDVLVVLILLVATSLLMFSRLLSCTSAISSLFSIFGALLPQRCGHCVDSNVHVPHHLFTNFPSCTTIHTKSQ